MNELLELDRNQGYRAASKLVDALKETWARNGEVDAWEIVGQTFDLSWKAIRTYYVGSENTEHVTNDAELGETSELEVYS